MNITIPETEEQVLSFVKDVINHNVEPYVMLNIETALEQADLTQEQRSEVWQLIHDALKPRGIYPNPFKPLYNVKIMYGSRLLSELYDVDIFRDYESIDEYTTDTLASLSCFSVEAHIEIAGEEHTLDVSEWVSEYDLVDNIYIEVTEAS